MGKFADFGSNVRNVGKFVKIEFWSKLQIKNAKGREIMRLPKMPSLIYDYF